MKKYAIDGLFITQRITGIQRYAYEICKELDKIIEKDEVEIVVPENASNLPDYLNIKIIKYGRRKGIAWQQIDLARYLRKKKRQGIFFMNTVPLLYREGIVTVHDVSYKANPQFFTGVRNKISALWHCMQYRVIAKSEMKILTVSNFSKSEIVKYYKVDPERITVTYNGWQHMNDISMADDTYDRYPKIKGKDFYFSMATMAPNKNVEWIIETAKNMPNNFFVIAGGGDVEKIESKISSNNIVVLGYISDDDAKRLMHDCKAFVFPTLYEGFGIPPLEAIASGAKSVYVSDTPCMKEIFIQYTDFVILYKNVAKIDCSKKVVEKIMNMYSWEKSSRQLKYIIDNRNDDYE